MLVDVARGGHQVVLMPVGTQNGGRMCRQAKDGLQLSFHATLFLRLHVGTNGEALVRKVDIILLAIAEAVDGEVGLEGVPGGEFVDAADVPAQALVAHLVVGAAGGGDGARRRTGGNGG